MLKLLNNLDKLSLKVDNKLIILYKELIKKENRLMYISLLTVAHVILAILLIIVVLLQRSESSMGALGGANAVFSGKGVSNILTKATTIIAVLFMLVSLAIVRINYHKEDAKSVVERVEVQQESPLATAVPATPADDKSAK